MFQVGDDVLLVGTTELRTKMPQIAKEMKTKKVVLIKRGAPFAVLSDFEQFEAQEKILDEFEDMVLGHIAKERLENSTEDDFVDAEVIEKELGL